MHVVFKTIQRAHPNSYTCYSDYSTLFIHLTVVWLINALQVSPSSYPRQKC